MSKCIFTTGSITQAIKAKQLLATYSLPVNSIKVSSSNRLNGCMHGIEFNCENMKNISNILTKHGIRHEEYR